MAITDGFKAFDPRLSISLKNTGFRELFKRALFKSLRGKAQLTGDGELIKIYSYLESEANEMGVSGVIKWGGKLMKVAVTSIEKKEGENIPKHFFQKSPSYGKYTTLTLNLPVPQLDRDGNVIGQEERKHVFYAERASALKWTCPCHLSYQGDEQLFAILENDVKLTPDLEGIDDYLEKLELILDAIFDDIVKSKKKFFFTFGQEPVPEEWQKVNDMLNKEIIGYVAMPKSAQDVGEGKDGVMKEGIDPDKIELKVIQPENKGRDLWADYYNYRREMLWKYGIRIDILESKEERAPVEEVKDANSYYDNIDNERKQCRLNFLSWVKDNWSGNYNLVYK